MRKRRLRLIASLPLAVAVIFGVLAMLPVRSSVTKENFDRIKQGMTSGEVAAILGKDCIPLPCAFITSWVNEDGDQIDIIFTDDGKVGNADDSKKWMPSDKTIAAKIRRWLHLD